MKTRQCFVSNSSTSSYVIFGVRIREAELKKMLFNDAPKVPEKYATCSHVFDRETMKFCPNCGTKAWSWGSDMYDDEDYEEAFREKGIDLTLTSDGYDWYVGKNIEGWSATMLADLPTIGKQIEELFGKSAKVKSVVCEG